MILVAVRKVLQKFIIFPNPKQLVALQQGKNINETVDFLAIYLFGLWLILHSIECLMLSYQVDQKLGLAPLMKAQIWWDSACYMEYKKEELCLRKLVRIS